MAAEAVVVDGVRGAAAGKAAIARGKVEADRLQRHAGGRGDQGSGRGVAGLCGWSRHRRRRVLSALVRRPGREEDHTGDDDRAGQTFTR
jgi:hypothetical protein